MSFVDDNESYYDLSMPSHPPSTEQLSVQTHTRAAGASPEGVARRWHSAQLFGERREIDIEHRGVVYRLRITSLGKLILTK
jgi:hemin uptake protein HemP